jgi:Zn-dependent protease
MPDATAELQLATADITLTRDAREALERAAAMASERGSDHAEATDVLTAILRKGGNLADRTIRALGGDPVAIAEHLAAPGSSAARSLSLRQLLVNANREAQVLGHYQVDSIHLLLAMLYSDSPATSGPLQTAGLTLYDLRRHLQTGSRPDFLPGESDRAQSGRSQPQRSGAQDSARPDAALRRKPWPSLRGVLSVSPVFLAIVGGTAASGALLWSGLLPGLVGPLTIVFVTAGWVASVCVHEFGHAVVAYLGGDRSVAASGYLTLNPLRYTNVLMSLIFPIVFLLLGGIGLPGGAVYINRSALRSRWWDSAVSLAGPAATLLCGLVVAAPFLVPGHEAWITPSNLAFFGALAFLGFVEAIAVVLNLVPVPGLDGFGILRPWLPYSTQDMANRFGNIAIIGVFIALFYVAPIRDNFFQGVLQLTNVAGIDQSLIAFGQIAMRSL